MIGILILSSSVLLAGRAPVVALYRLWQMRHHRPWDWLSDTASWDQRREALGRQRTAMIFSLDRLARSVSRLVAIGE